MTIPEPTPEDMARDAPEGYAEADYAMARRWSGGMALPWIRRAVAAERERDESRKRIANEGTGG